VKSVTKELAKYNIDFLGVYEVKWDESGLKPREVCRFTKIEIQTKCSGKN
jgi:hypothetical protein